VRNYSVIIPYFTVDLHYITFCCSIIFYVYLNSHIIHLGEEVLLRPQPQGLLIVAYRGVIAMSKVVTIGTAIAALVSSSALAADIPLKAPQQQPIVSWTGCYLGANVGAGWAHKEFKDPVLAAPAVADYGHANGSGPLAGGQVGCDYQWNRLVLGVRGSYDWSSIDTRNTMAPSRPDLNMHLRMRDLAAVTGRLGFTWSPNVLVYADGGAVWSREREDVFFTAPGIRAESARFTANGWTVGGGMEVMLASNFSFFAEFNHMDFGTSRACHTLAPGIGFIGTPCANGGNTIDTKQTVNAVTVGLNYRFGGVRY
jgi:outer membrane immunogenic protein